MNGEQRPSARDAAQRGISVSPALAAANAGRTDVVPGLGYVCAATLLTEDVLDRIKTLRRLEEIGAEFVSDLATGAEDVPGDPRVGEAIELVKRLEAAIGETLRLMRGV